MTPAAGNPFPGDPSPGAGQQLLRPRQLKFTHIPIPALIRHTKSRAVYTVVYTVLQGKFDAILTGMGKGNAW
jgi:hypothetical protein